jgi:hypothetical protein
LGILGTFGKNFMVRDDLVLSPLHLQQVAKLVRLTRPPLANDFGVRLENAQDLMGILSTPLKYSRLGLLHHLSHTARHGFQNLRESLQPRLPTPWKIPHFLQRSIRLLQNLSR